MTFVPGGFVLDAEVEAGYFAMFDGFIRLKCAFHCGEFCGFREGSSGLIMDGF